MTTEQSLQAWDKAYADRVVESVNTIRAISSITIPRLRDLLEEYGWSASVDTLNGIFSSRKRKSFTFGELLALARALDVTPMYLLLGLPSAEPLASGPVLASGEILDVYRELAGDTSEGAPDDGLWAVRRVASALASLEWQNALWIVRGVDPRLDETEPYASGLDGLVHWDFAPYDAIERLAFRYRMWIQQAEVSPFTARVPPLPKALRGHISDRGLVLDMPRKPLEGLSSDAVMARAERHVIDMRAAQARLDELKEREARESSRTISEANRRLLELKKLDGQRPKPPKNAAPANSAE